MANLLGQNIGTNYKGILNLNTLNGNLSATLQAITDGDGNASPLTLSTGEVGISRTIALSAGSSNVRLINQTYTINNSGAQTGTGTGIFLNATETALNGMTHNLMDLQVGGTSRFRITGNCAIATFDLNGLNIANSVRATDFQIGASSSRLLNSSDGVIRMANNADNGFGRLQFGGTTSSFPAIARQGTTSNIVICLADAAAGASLGVGMASATALSASAILQSDSTTKGFLPPRMTTAQRDLISSPAAGLMIYNTSTNLLNFYNGSVWGAV
jgi:hypothetical protein